SRGRLYDRTVRGTGVAIRDSVVAAVIGSQPGTPIPTTAPEWQDGSTLTAKRISEVADTLGADLRNRSAALQDEASDGAGLAAVILLVALVVALAVMVVVGRHLLGSLAALRSSALDVAERALPAAVARIRDRGENAGQITLAPVPVRSMDEVGQVARAFDAVQRQALRLAIEQAGLRAKYSSVFVNLSRRSQGLVQRQLQLLERLERDEEDADQLATLFQLDHLATRMRRNNENLMVLSGSEVGRRTQRPTSLADLLRASVSEIEQYQRVVLLPPPSVRVVGYAVGDLVRLVAELLDNATAFSAPDTEVTVASHSFEDGSLCIAVHDEGIGMSQSELDEANHKITDAGSIDVSTSRRMGLFVIGRLAGRHGIEVRLNSGHDTSGVRATVTRAAPPPARTSPAGWTTSRSRSRRSRRTRTRTRRRTRGRTVTVRRCRAARPATGCPSRRSVRAARSSRRRTRTRRPTATMTPMPGTPPVGGPPARRWTGRRSRRPPRSSTRWCRPGSARSATCPWTTRPPRR
ncbi:MAG: histidine kinase, partial [Pseudonocardiaceae bacterium]|nr:histidine kinase [Pseudonocardiaceae bacterium]